ncbi:MAG: hypothetical protein JXR70_14680 [Spirochaetales bacterium]|nr:hypothetical protein [Bacteroidales bacterium]MBN2738227.1 hypothetical protein [Spirochaetales bacterium]
MKFDKICKNNIYQYLLEQIPNFQEIYKDEIEADDDMYYIFGRLADRFQTLQVSELHEQINEKELKELNDYYQFINNISSMPIDKYTEELIAYGFFENIDTSINNFKNTLLCKLYQNAKNLFFDTEKFWNKNEHPQPTSSAHRLPGHKVAGLADSPTEFIL